MNEKLKQLAKEAGFMPDNFISRWDQEFEKLFELIVQECVTKMALEIMDEQWVDDAVKNTYKHFGVEE